MPEPQQLGRLMKSRCPLEEYTSKVVAGTMSDFVISEYRQFAELVMGARIVSTFTNVRDLVPNALIWRHDVDVSLRAAAELAAIDNSLGLVSHFFVNPRAATYNISSQQGRDQLSQIKDLGHSIDLHLEILTSDEVKSADDLESVISQQAECLADAVGTKVQCFSFHNPNSWLLGFDAESYCGLINCYSSLLRKSAAYVSDSNGFWRFMSVVQAHQANEGRPLHVLTHPEWWSDAILAPRERLSRQLFLDINQYLQTYDQMLSEASRLNISNLQAVPRLQSAESLQLTFQASFPEVDCR